MTMCPYLHERPESEDELFLLAAVAVSLEFTSQRKAKAQKTDSNRSVRHFV